MNSVVRPLAILSLLLLGQMGGAFAQAQSGATAPTLPEKLMPAGSQVELIKDGFKFTEGPALSPDGAIFFNDIPNNRTHRYDPATGEVTVAREDTGAANGLAFDAQGALLACEGGNRVVTRQMPMSNIETIASDCDGKKLNSPNDLDIDQKGGVYFTDPRYGKKDDVEQPTEGVYYLPAGGGAKVVRVIDSLKKPNGISLSKDGKTLYIADNGDGSLHAFDVNAADGTVSNGRLLSAEAPVCDGMCVDALGNLYVTTSEGVKVFTADGKHLGTIVVPLAPANCAFGAKGTKTLYITARGGFFKVKMAVDGIK